MATETFRLPDSSYEELTRIIKAYGALTTEASPSDVSRILGKDPTSVSRNNPFLIAVGILEGKQKKIMTPAGRALARALEYEMPDEITRQWRQVVDSTEFFQSLLSAIRIRRGMELTTLRGHVAYSAGQPRTPRVMAGAGAVIDILRAASLVREEDGRLIAVAGGEGVPATSETTEKIAERQAEQEEALGGVRIPVSLTIQVQIQCSPEDLDELPERLRGLIRDLDQRE
jgi:hypothetical protein